MKRFFYIPLLFLFLCNCKKDKINTQPDEIMKPLVGKWYLVEVEQIVNGEKVWVPFAGYETVYLNFRFDGILIDENGKTGCCSPYIYIINNRRFEVKPRTSVSYSANCSTFNCGVAFCSTYNIEPNGNQMMIARCSSARSKYVRAE
ncbi:hypothetical protein [Dyadobacter sp. CY356]|uniref:hypothetical protein n=1 Tax=Dyadobacter sp. CY356 TaxID=2906442 RepID=UPI001F180F0F|nr:hypothetical protein [Dyadobacter sp. CY356]MCF0057285.1 hypothetical protein [Dyadobacter sp. CY356]